ncbi:bifunctional glutamate N-acetyltransferase/amino-acid acetyltransferase ArgJ [Thermodesulfobacterium sp. TA1]|uniref:bifunctional glutamate N-acetyltransferase/amino-acid acetyltransferase ArgJ n=1 Tax=Thermodesulfobacterium sp. TA1 TaxID=2234087 RepID=UPI001231A48A|nr:bifunctional glutamate N-acetyltransferase/amino-acid acetyltransferase ArgJ [Thermodesulfobacterium sp. TA1]QER42569.1 bifunctional glutamate N-acetyltransferase/amino-acid acetyltransferase ArgJ [Thermodesulfobacterium sp. TA1]
MKAPEGFLFSAVKCSIKKLDKFDLGLIYSPHKLTAWGVFTKNTVQAAPVVLGKRLIKGENLHGVVVNSGVANACTGEEGIERAKKLLEEVAKGFKLEPQSFLPASTGVIGEQLPLEKMLSQVPELLNKLSPDRYLDFTQAIMTTDTFPKISYRVLEDGVSILGIAKGAGMIAPNMATMLGFILTDAKVSKETLKKLLPKIVDQSFNRITVDGDTSTNDTVYMLCSNLKDLKNWNHFEKACLEVAQELAYLIVKDGEGASKVIKIIIKGAKTKEDAKAFAFSVANSPLVKTAVYGEDANWGRIFAALGKTGIPFDFEKVEIYLNGLTWIKNLQVITEEEKLRKELQKETVELLIKLKEGKKGFEVWTSDFTEEYIKINAHYRT